MAIITLRSGDQVSNIEDTAPCHSRYKTWKNFWIQKSDGHEWPNECRIAWCTNTATCGAHVEVKGRKSFYILPTCRSCNAKRPGQWLYGNAKAVAVRVYASDTKGDGNCYRR